MCAVGAVFKLEEGLELFGKIGGYVVIEKSNSK